MNCSQPLCFCTDPIPLTLSLSSSLSSDSSCQQINLTVPLQPSDFSASLGSRRLLWPLPLRRVPTAPPALSAQCHWASPCWHVAPQPLRTVSYRFPRVRAPLHLPPDTLFSLGSPGVLPPHWPASFTAPLWLALFLASTCSVPSPPPSAVSHPVSRLAVPAVCRQLLFTSPAWP